MSGINGLIRPMSGVEGTSSHTAEWTAEKEVVLLEALADLKNFNVEKDGPEAEEWVDGKMEKLKEIMSESTIGPHVFVDYEKVREAFLFAYLSHFGQRRKLGSIPYAEHLFGSITQYIKIKEKEYSVRKPPQAVRVELTNDYIKLLLHDLLEDFMKGVELEKEEKTAWFTFMSAYIHLRFGQDVSDFVSYVATKYSKRPFTKLPEEKQEKDRKKMEDSRVDLLALLLGITEQTHNAVGLILKAAERRDNLLTVGGLPGADIKAKETYNMALACFAGGFRTPGKDLLDEGFRHVYIGEKQKVFEDFETKIRQWQENDRLLFEEVGGDLRREIGEVLGHDDFEISYRPLHLWRSHEQLMRAYKEDRGDDVMGGLNLLDREILNDEYFDRVIEENYLGRIVVLTKSWSDAAKVAKSELPSFKRLDRQVYSGHSLFRKPTILDKSGYKAERVLTENIDHPNRVLEIKITSKEADEKNEHGSPFYVTREKAGAVRPDGEEIVEERYFDKSLQNFIGYLGALCDAEKAGSFDRVKHALSQPMGSDLSKIADDIRIVKAKIGELNLYGLINTRG